MRKVPYIPTHAGVRAVCRVSSTAYRSARQARAQGLASRVVRSVDDDGTWYVVWSWTRA